MRITFILPTTGDSAIGGVRVVCEYANRLKEKGHIVKVVYPLIHPRIGPRFSLRNVRFQAEMTWHDLKRGKKISWFTLKAELVRIPTISPKFVKLVEKLVPDAEAVIATSWETAYFVNKLAEKKGRKFYFVQHYEIWDLLDNEAFWK